MVVYIIMGTLAAFGGLCFLWLLVYWMLDKNRGGTVVCFGQPSEVYLLLARLMMLREIGILRCSIGVSASELQDWEIRRLEELKIEVLKPEEFALRLKNGVEKIDRAGTGDH